jgi:hypothetical protein
MLEEGETELNVEAFKEKINLFLNRKGKPTLDTSEVKNLVEDTGFMYIDSKDNVGFKHSSFLEYFASSEIFNHERPDYEPKLIDNFDQPHWQNTAVFFAGISNDLPRFISKLLQSLNPQSIDDLNVYIGGLGYISQALYQLDPELHTSIVKQSVDYSFQLLLELERFSESKDSFLRSVKPHSLVLLVCYWFRLNFSSITLTDTLHSAFEEIDREIPDNNKFEKTFKLFLLSSTLTHKYIGDGSKLLDLTNKEIFKNSPIMVISSKFFFDNVTLPDSEHERSISDNIDHHASRFEDIFDYITGTPIRKLDDSFVDS